MSNFPELDLDTETVLRGQMGDFIMSVHGVGKKLGDVAGALMMLSIGWDEFPGDEEQRKDFVHNLTHAMLEEMSNLAEAFQKAHMDLFGEEMPHDPGCEHHHDNED